MLRLQWHSPAAFGAARQLTTSRAGTNSQLAASLSLRARAGLRIRNFNTAPNLYGRVSIVVPQMAESISEGTLATIHKQPGERVEADEEVASLETDKVDVSVNAPEAGRLVDIHAAESDTVTVGQKIVTVETGGDAEDAPEPSPSQVSKPEYPEKPQEPPTKESPEPEPRPSPSPSPSAPAQPSPTQSAASQAHPHLRQERAERMPRIRQAIARRLKESQNRTASLTTVQRVDMSALMEWRKQNKENTEKEYGVRLGYMGAFTKASTLAAQEVPLINGAMDIDREAIIYRDYVDISIAVSTPKGLVTPVLRNTESLGIIEIERRIAFLAAKARENNLTMDDLSGGNFSISNPGSFGSMFGTPLINYPQSAVFNMNSIKDEPVVVDGKITIRPLMFITLTYDHRLVDGREAVIFLNKVKDYIESPASMLLATRPLDG